MSSYDITFYSRDDLTFGRDEDGNFTVTVNEGATPETITIVDGDAGEAGNTFAGSTGRGDNAFEHNQAAFGEVDGVDFDGEPIQPVAALPGLDNPDDQIMAISVGEPSHTVGFGFTFAPTPGETVAFDYDGVDESPNFNSEVLHVEGDISETSTLLGADEAEDGSGPSDTDEGGSGPSGKDGDEDEDGSRPSGEGDEDEDGSGPSGEDDGDEDGSGPSGDDDEDEDGSGPSGDEDEGGSGPSGEGDEDEDGSGPSGEGDGDEDGSGPSGEDDGDGDGPGPSGEGDADGSGPSGKDDEDEDGSGPSGEGDEDEGGSGPSGEGDADEDGSGPSGEDGDEDGSSPSGDGDEGLSGTSGTSGGSGSSGSSGSSGASGSSGGSGPSGGGSGPSTPPCFTRGTAIRTARGEVMVEALVSGDMVWTEAHGMQPIRWICQRVVPAKGDFAPIKISAGTLGADRDILVSPAHRMLVQGPEIEVLFGMTKALVAAKDLVNDATITRVTTLETVEYFHILFDQHEVLEAHGTLSESFFPQATAVGGIGAAQRKELFALFPELEFGSHSYCIAYPGLMPHEMALFGRQEF